MGLHQTKLPYCLIKNHFILTNTEKIKSSCVILHNVEVTAVESKYS